LADNNNSGNVVATTDSLDNSASTAKGGIPGGGSGNNSNSSAYTEARQLGETRVASFDFCDTLCPKAETAPIPFAYKDENVSLADAVRTWLNSLKEAKRLSPIRRLKRKVNDGDNANPLENASFGHSVAQPERQNEQRDDGSGAVRLVGLSKVKALLNPRHPWFADRQGELDGWRRYQCKEVARPVVAYPNLSLATDRLNPYKLSMKAVQSAMKSLRGLGDVLAENDVRDVKVLDLGLTFPGEITEWFMGRNHGFTRESEAEAWKLWREMWRKAVYNGRGKNRTEILPSLEGFLLNGKAGKLGCHANLHLWSTEKPWQAHWHFHVLAVNQSYAEGKFAEVGHYLEGERLEDLKRLWKVRLLGFASKHGIKVPSLKGKALPVVYFQYIDGSDRAKVVHKWQYVNRSPLEDFALYSNDKPGCPDPPDWLVDYDNRARAYGWFRELKAILGKEVYEALNEDEQVKTCPMCGGRMQPTGILANAELIPIADKGALYSLEWVRGNLRSVPLTRGDLAFLTDIPQGCLGKPVGCALG